MENLRTDDLLLIVAAGLLFIFLRRKQIDALLCRSLDEATLRLDGISPKLLPFAIVLASSLALFAELAMIRLHGGYLQIFALLKNVSLLSCFLGLGVGFIWASSKKLLLPLQPVILTFQLLVFRYLLDSGILVKLGNPFTDESMLGLLPATGISKVLVICVVLFIFSLNVLTFIPLGQLIGYLMRKLDGPLAYRYNLIGSLVGVGIFSLMNFLWLGGTIWIITYGLMLIPFLISWNCMSILGVVGVLAASSLAEQAKNIADRKLYSPYQTLSMSVSRQGGVELSTNTLYYQRILNLSDQYVRIHPELEQTRRYYELPYSLLSKNSNVLIVGSGTGNDVAAALRRNVSKVTALEIDPVIAEIGELLHPEDPYHSERVALIVSDARAYIKRTDVKYDAIIYGLLDSHALLSGRVSGLRLDSYVYTVEGLRESRALLNSRGFLSLSFVSMSPEAGRKLYLMLTEAFNGETPYVLKTVYDGAISFIAGRSLSAAEISSLGDFEDITATFSDSSIIAEVSTDDWPYFYMPRRVYPLSYFTLWVPIFVISYLFLAPSTRSEKIRIDGTSFFLGAAFMLLETKSFTEMALVCGSTFSVTVMIIFVILSLALVSNELVIKKVSISSSKAFVLLLLAVTGGYLSTFLSFSSLPWLVEAFIRAICLTLPIFFSGVCFSRQLEKRGGVVSPMASNLIGAMFGGILEYLSMVTGFRFLYVVVAALYFMAYVFLQQRAIRVSS